MCTKVVLVEARMFVTDCSTESQAEGAECPPSGRESREGSYGGQEQVELDCRRSRPRAGQNSFPEQTDHTQAVEGQTARHGTTSNVAHS